MSSSSIETANKDLQLLTIEETATMLRLKAQTLYSWIHFKQIPSEIYISLGSKRKLFIKSKLEEWLWKGAELKKRPKK